MDETIIGGLPPPYPVPLYQGPTILSVNPSLLESNLTRLESLDLVRRTGLESWFTLTTNARELLKETSSIKKVGAILNSSALYQSLVHAPGYNDLCYWCDLYYIIENTGEQELLQLQKHLEVRVREAARLRVEGITYQDLGDGFVYDLFRIYCTRMESLFILPENVSVFLYWRESYVDKTGTAYDLCASVLRLTGLMKLVKDFQEEITELGIKFIESIPLLQRNLILAKFYTVVPKFVDEMEVKDLPELLVHDFIPLRELAIRRLRSGSIN